MKMEKLTIKAREAVTGAVGIASASGNPEVTPLHIASALLGDETGTIPGVMNRSCQNPPEGLSLPFPGWR